MATHIHSFHNHRFSFARGELALHKNLMTCIIVGQQRPVLVSNEDTQLEAQIVCIKPDIPHRVTIPDGGAEIVYLDGVRLLASQPVFAPLSPAWLALPDAFDDPNQAALAAFRTQLNTDNMPPDPDVMKIINDLYCEPFTRMSQADLSDKLALERTQALRHFKATTGQTFRRFKIWAAIVAATRSAHNGEQIGLAGIESGFADAAHLARTAGIVFGVTPTAGLSGLTQMITRPSVVERTVVQ